MASLLGRFFGKRDPEKNSGIPVEVPGGERPLTMQEMIQRYIRQELAGQVAVEKGEDVDSFDEADDFEEDDPEIIPLTHHQVIAMDESELRESARSLYGIDLVDTVAGGTVPVPAGSSGGDKASNPAEPAVTVKPS